MSFSLRSILATALALSHLAMAGPFTLRYWNSGGCGGIGLGCNGYDTFQCCAAPPNPASFPYARVTSSGPAGFVVFTRVTSGGGCGICESTGSLNVCYDNTRPFNTMFAVNLSQCQHTAGTRSLDGKILTPLEDQVQECKEIVPIDTAEIGGRAYRVEGEQGEQIMADVLGMDAEAFHFKWAHIQKGPVSDDSVME